MSTMTPTEPSVALPLPPPEEVVRITVDRYDRMIESGELGEDDPIELLNGVMVWKMARGPSNFTITRRCSRKIEPLLPAGWHVRQEGPVRLPDFNEPEPDVAVVRGDDDAYERRHPGPGDIALIVEVAESSLQRNRGEKRQVYARARIPAYWIINLVDRQVESYSGAGGGDYAEHTSYSVEQSVPLIIDGQPAGSIAVASLLPQR